MENEKKLSSERLQSIYHERFKGRLSYRDEVWKVLLSDFFSRWFRSTDTVLDIGAGYGEFINNVSAQKKYAMDLNPEVHSRVHADVTVLLQDCSEPWPLPDASLDAIFTSNFFEHLPDKQALSRTLAEAYRCLKPGGKLVAMGPNIKYVPGAYWDFLDHYIPLTELSVSEACKQEGFLIEKCIDRFLPYTMATGPQYPLVFVRLFLLVPLAWRVFGKQFVIVALKAA